MNNHLRYTPGVSELTCPKLRQAQLDEYLHDIFIARSGKYKLEYVGGSNQLHREGWEWLGYWRQIPVKEEFKKKLFKYII